MAPRLTPNVTSGLSVGAQGAYRVDTQHRCPLVAPEMPFLEFFPTFCHHHRGISLYGVDIDVAVSDISGKVTAVTKNSTFGN